MKHIGDYMESPILKFETAIASAPFAIAPEKADELLGLRDSRNIAIQMLDRPGFSIDVLLVKNVIRLPIAALEYLWACAHYYWVISQEYREAQLRGDSAFDLTGNERLRNAGALLEWAGVNMRASARTSWPDNLPSPARSSDDGDVEVANELFLAGLAWILHHELAHLSLNHTALLSSREETEADIAATDMILGDLEMDDPRMKKRAIGIAVALLCMQSLEADAPASVDTHPAAHQRIWTCMQRYVVGQKEDVEAFLVAALSVMFAPRGVHADVDGGSFTDILADLLVKIHVLQSA